MLRRIVAVSSSSPVQGRSSNGDWLEFLSASRRFYGAWFVPVNPSFDSTPICVTDFSPFDAFRIAQGTVPALMGVPGKQGLFSTLY